MKTPFKIIAATLACVASTLIVASCGAQEKPNAVTPPTDLFAPGDEVTLGGQTFFVKDVGGWGVVLSTPVTPTATLGAFIAPVGAEGSSTQNGTPWGPDRSIDGSGLRELYPGSGLWVHTSNEYDSGGSFWVTGGGDTAPTVVYDLGKDFNVSGLYFWNYNQGGDWSRRGWKGMTIESSNDKQDWAPVGTFDTARAPGNSEYQGQTIAFEKKVSARYFRLKSQGNYGDGQSGLAEVRFANADVPYAPPRAFTPKYPRPTYPKLAQGQKLEGAENIVFPAAANVVDVSKAPYGAKGDGETDDTDAIQKALDDNPARGAIIYLPNGRYLVSRQLQWGGSKDMAAQNAAKNTIMWGQSKNGTIIQLKDRCPGFVDPRSPRGVIWTGTAPAQRFGNEIHNLTVDTGVRNNGASGIQFIANNQGGVYDVRIQSGDGQGIAGLDLGYTDEQGPMLVKNVETLGFDTGVSSATSVASWTGEGISVRLPNKVGFLNGGQPASVRLYKFQGDVPAVQNTGGLLTLVDSTITGSGDAGDATAVTVSGGAIFLRNLQTTGFGLAVDDTVADAKLNGPNVAEHSSIKPTTLLVRADKSLGLPIKETPVDTWDDPAQWVTPKTNDSAGIQAAIDSGAKTVLLPRALYVIGSQIVVRGNVERILGTKAYFEVHDPLRSSNGAVFQIADGASPVVTIEGVTTGFDNGPFTFIDHASKRTLVLKQLILNFGAAQTPSHLTYRNSVPGGQVFIEDVVSGRWNFKGQQVWARQFNPEPTGEKLVVDGGSFWCLGYKTERIGQIAIARNGARIEILGGMSQTSGSADVPMFVNEGGQMSVYFSEVNNSPDPYSKFVVETQAGQTKEWGNPDKGFRGWRAVFYEGRLLR